MNNENGKVLFMPAANKREDGGQEEKKPAKRRRTTANKPGEEVSAETNSGDDKEKKGDTITFRAPIPITAAIERWREITGQNRSDAIVDLVRKGLGFPSKDSILSEFEEYKDRVESLEIEFLRLARGITSGDRPLTAAQLAKRVGWNVVEINNGKKDPDFPDTISKHDPEGKRWVWDGEAPGFIVDKGK